MSDNDSSELYTKGRLGNLLTAIALGEGEAEHAAAQLILKFEATPDYPVQLTELVSDSNQPAKMRILACSKLQDYLKSHWCSTAKEFLAPEINEENKTTIKKLLFIGLKEFEREVREGVADIIVCIARWEWPHNWPQYFQMLLDCLKDAAGEPSVLGGLRVLQKFIYVTADAHTSSIGVVILSEMIRIFICKDKYSVESRIMACRMFSEYVSCEALFNNPDNIQRYLKPAVLQFTGTLIQIWTSPESDEELKSTILKVVEELMEELPKYISDFLTNMLPLVWGTLIDCAKDYKANVVDGGDGQEKENESIATRMGNYSDGLVKPILTFLEQLMNCEHRYCLNISDFKLSQNEWFYLQDCFTTPKALRHVIMMIEVTEKQIELWNTDFDDFVEQELMIETTKTGIRGTALDLIMSIRIQGLGITSSLIMVIMKYLEEENKKRIDGQSGVGQNSWKSHEAFLVAFCVMKDCIVGTKNGNSLRYDVVPFLENIVLADLVNHASHPFLVCRCLTVGGKYSGQMPNKLGSAFLESTVNCLQENQPALVKISAVHAVSLWYHQNESEERKNSSMLLPHVPALFEGLLTIAESVKSARVYELCLEGTAYLMPFDKTLTATLASKIYSLTQTVLLENNFAEWNKEWLTVFEELMLNHDCLTFLRKRVTIDLPKMMIIGPLENYRTGSAALRMMTVLVKHSPLPLSSFLIDTLFFAACNYIIGTDNWQHIQCDGMKLIQTYISVASGEVLSYRDENGRCGAQYILQVVLRDLSRKTYTTKTGEACKILILLIKKSWYEIRENIDEMLKTLLHSIRKEKFVHTTRKLSMVYAHLISRQSDTIFQFFTNALSPLKQKSSLEIIISEGLCELYPSLIGEKRATVKLALGKVLEHAVTNPSSPLYRITFEESSGGSTIPLLVKICRLVVESTDDQK